jgi:hypothetical protein
MYMKRKLLINLIGFFAAVFIVVPFFGLNVFAGNIDISDGQYANADAILLAITADLNDPDSGNLTVVGNDYLNRKLTGNVTITLPVGKGLSWQAQNETINLTINVQAGHNSNIGIQGNLKSLTLGDGVKNVYTSSTLTISNDSGSAITLGSNCQLSLQESTSISLSSTGADLISSAGTGTTITIKQSATNLNLQPSGDYRIINAPSATVTIEGGADISEAEIAKILASNYPEPVPDPPPTTTIPDPEPTPEPDSSSSSSSSYSEPEPTKPSVGDVILAEEVVIIIPEAEVKSETAGETASETPVYVPPKIVVADTTPIVVDDKEYAGTVKVDSVNSDKPQGIPKEVVIGGESYLVGETVYIVGTEEKKVEATAETGFSYVFTAVENSDKPVKFSAEGLPDALEMTEDGVIVTKTLPIPAGEYTIKVTADNGADTNEYTMTIEIKEGGLTDEELIAALTANDSPDLTPEILSLPGDELGDEIGEEAAEGENEEGEEGTEGESKSSVPTLWVNGDVSLHYTPETTEFFALFLDGKLLEKDVDYGIKEGSTVIILTEQTMTALPSGDHVVTTMFHQKTDVGLDTVINDVGSSSFVFRFGDEKTSGKRVNIGGDGVSGSVTFDDTKSKEEPITAISANTEAIEERAANLSNATGREIISAFETKQHGGFGGKTATFAISVKSLDLTLKNGTAVYVAVYDSTTDKTYQNKGEVKDGMIVFRTKHSGVFMVSLEKY